MSKKKEENLVSKRKTPSLPRYDEYALITLDENHALQVKNDNLIQRVQNTTAFIKDAETAFTERDKLILDENEWQAHLNCDSIPKPFEPQAIQNFFYKISHFEDEYLEQTVNWLLSVDERSILNQDTDSVDLTKKCLKETRINFGKQYDTRVNDTMVILKRIQNFLETPTKVITERQLRDVKEMKSVAYDQINHYIDNLAFRILSCEEAYMDPIDVTTAEYSYNAQHFDIHLWAFKKVPIHLDPQETPSKTIKLTQIKTDLVVPFGVLCENLVIRGLHCRFDRFSEHARYFDLPTFDEAEQSLSTCLRKEWQSQMKIQTEVKASMIKQRADFEEAMRLKAEEEELKAKQEKQKENKGSQKRKDKPAKVKKIPKEPPIVTPGVVPLIRMDFLNYDSLEHREKIMKFHPDSLGLSKGEVNLRKFQILGGVYQLNSLSKPNTTTFPKLVMVSYKSNNLIEPKNIPSELDPSPSNDVSKFFQITFELPEYFCHWGEPTPCLFEEGYSRVGEQNGTARSLNIGSPIIINDFNLHEFFTNSKMYDLIEHSIPRLISSFKFPEDLYDEEEEKKAKSTLGRTKMSDEEHEKERTLFMQKQLMSFDVQNWPERLFPVFEKVLPVVILPTHIEKERSHPYEYFSDFMSTLESIKDSYQKPTFKDKLGNPIKISTQKYDKGIRRCGTDTITRKFILYDTRTTEEGQLGDNGAGGKSSLEPKGYRTDRQERMVETKKSDDDEGKVPGNEPDNEVPRDRGKDEKQSSFSKWSTANIFKTEFNAKDRKVTVWTDRLGTFGFAFNRYQHFPFQRWSLQPSKENPQEVELAIDSVFAAFRIRITPDGYKACVTNFTQTLKSRKIYLEIQEPIKNIKTLKEKLQQKHLNIFPERDASWYMSGYFSEKHLAAEFHIYKCLSLYATSLKFKSSIWNKFSNRRNMILKFGELRDLEEDFVQVRISPEDVMFVEIKEACTDLETIELDYTATWRNLEWYPDLNHLIISSFSNVNDMRLKDSSMIHYLKTLLQAIRPLSCS